MANLRTIYDDLAGQKVQRIEAISDGVFAIALTLLVLDIRVPVAEAIRSGKELLAAFMKLAPKLLSYFLNFITLGIFFIIAVQLNYALAYLAGTPSGDKWIQESNEYYVRLHHQDPRQ